ncbi:rod shape-determining protein MreC [Balneola sp. MJW-20]|uniref:rod shape-determining protein MreC n=1 Tax=Gracilimonas aurantiaca TaxID=3234185 RepID=UPI003465E729
MRFRIFKVTDAKDYIITSLLLVFALAIMFQRHSGGIRTLRQVSIATLSLVEEPLSNIRIYRQALNTNDYLQEQNILLQDELSRLRTLEQENRELRAMLAFRDSSVIRLHPSRIVAKDLNGQNNFVTIDAGTNDSLIVGMPLITSNGLVGRIVLTSRNYSQVMPFYNSLFRVSARVQDNQALGIVSWSGEPYSELIMNYVPRTIPVDSGDVIETSGYGNEFPSGIPIGTVLRTEDEAGKETQIIYLQPYVNLAEITKGFVVKFRPDTGLVNLKEDYEALFE